MKNVLVALEDPHLSESMITEGDRSYLHYLWGCVHQGETPERIFDTIYGVTGCCVALCGVG